MAAEKFAVVLAAAGKSTRFADPHYKKPFAKLGDRAVWLHAAKYFVDRPDVAQVIVVISPDDQSYFSQMFGSNAAVMGIDVVLGGQRRQDSVANGLAAVKPEIEMVAIHDAARPCLHEKWIDRVFQQATKSGAAILSIPVHSTLKKSSDGTTIDQTVDRESLYLAQTPQVFRKNLIEQAMAEHGQTDVTDEAQLFELMGQPVSLVEGSTLNIKITTKQDMKLAGAIMKSLGGIDAAGGKKVTLDDLFG